MSRDAAPLPWIVGGVVVLGLLVVLGTSEEELLTAAGVAPACRRALADASARWPSRSRASDGLLPSAQHLIQSPNSDHNRGEAFDLTHDPAAGADGGAVALLAMDDPRTKYVIWNRRIWSRARASEGWRPYSGSNPHEHHVHVSILPTAREDVSPWPWAPGLPLPSVLA